MNGAIAELWATMINAPSRNSTTIIGTNHQRLLLTRNENSSPATPRFRVAVRRKFITSPQKVLLPFCRPMERGVEPTDSTGTEIHPACYFRVDSTCTIVPGGWGVKPSYLRLNPALLL